MMTLLCIFNKNKMRKILKKKHFSNHTFFIILSSLFSHFQIHFSHFSFFFFFLSSSWKQVSSSFCLLFPRWLFTPLGDLCHFYFLFFNDFSRHVSKSLTQKFFKQSFLWTTGRKITKAREKKDVTLDDVDDKRYWGRDIMQVERQENGWMSGLQERDLFESLSHLHSSCFAQKHHSSLKVVNTFLSLKRQLLPTSLFSFIPSPTTQ